MEFDEFFETATGRQPYGYQRRLAQTGLPSVVQAPTGSGKTGIVLAWLWRRLYGPDPAATPRRLIYALPQRSLVDQVADETDNWLARLGLAESVGLHVVMGGKGASQWQWRTDMHRPAVVVGTVDSLVSKALNRGYGIGRATYPADFALVTNGAHWVIDEIQLCPESTTTMRQIAAFARIFPTAEPFGLTCMSATVPENLLETADNPLPGLDDVLAVRSEDRVGELAVRLAASRTVRRLAAEPGDYAAIAAAAAEVHRPASLTLVVLNTVDAARKVFAALPHGPAKHTLIHSRFRGHERQELARQVAAQPGAAGHIVIATQVVEAGLDLNASGLITEAAPWPSIVQRAGRCNRTGRIDSAQIRWILPARHLPYLEQDVAATAAELSVLEGQQVTGEDLARRDVAVTEPEVAVLRRADLVGLFDTASDLSGADLDVTPYIRDAEELDARLVWATWKPEDVKGTPATDGRPPANVKLPTAEWWCRAPLAGVAVLAKQVPVWRLGQMQDRWTKVSAQERARPGEVLLVAASDGGYDPVLGFDPAVRRPVTEPGPEAEPAAGSEDRFSADSASTGQRAWVSLRQHSEETRDQAESLLSAIGPGLADEARQAIVMAAYLHDTGKSHKTWQDALCNLALPEERDDVETGRPWAKSRHDGRLRFAGGTAFRHELASLLLIDEPDGPLRGLLAESARPDLVRYLVLAHHGKLRIQVRDPDQKTPGVLLGLEHGMSWQVEPQLGQPAGVVTVDLDQFSLGGQRSWTRAALELRDRYGPFVLAYLETVVRVADWRSSAGMKMAHDS
ncbi:MAG: type I-G CRISPR-associated helicase/endonuclease Cas3g [Streptosporangiaceae bacterium]